MKEDIREILSTFLQQVEDDVHTRKHFPKLYSGLDLKVGFGAGRTAKIPWISFLGKEQQPQNGIFPVYYFFKEHHKLILAYGISETVIPKKKWMLEPSIKTIASYFKSLRIVPHKYGLSFIHAVYDTNEKLDFDKIETDLDAVLDYYKKIISAK